MKNNFVYLCGNIDGRTFSQAIEWRLKAVEMFAQHDIIALSPLRGKHHLFKDDEIIINENHAMQPIERSDEFIRTRDLGDVTASRVLLVNAGNEDAIFTGTVAEVFYASEICRPRIPVIAFVLGEEYGEKPNIQVKSPWFGGYFIPPRHVENSLKAGIELALKFFI